MLNPQEVSNLIEEKLNEIGKTWHDPYTFKLFSEVGEDKGGADIRGILRSDSAEFAPVPGDYTEGKFIYSVDLPVPAARANYHFLQVKGIVEELIKNNQNLSHKFTNGNGILTFAEKKTGAYKNTYGTGETVTMPFSVAVTYTENAVTSADKHWLLDGVEIPYLEESVTVEREGTNRNVFHEQSTRLLLTSQTKYYTFRIPYESEFWYKLQREILNSTISVDFNPSHPPSTHELKYYDGVSFTEQAPYKSNVKIFRSGKSSSVRPDASTFDVTFTDCHVPNVHFQLGLLDFPFDMNGEDTRYFSSKQEQIAYFNDKVSNGSTPFINIDVPSFDSLFITQQVYQAPVGLPGKQFDYANKNYAVLQVSLDKNYYFYYYITKSTIGADGKMLLDLRLDTVQTFFFDPNISFSDCMIERAHLNRFQEVGTNPAKVYFIDDPASKIFNAEEGMNFPKRLVDRQKLSLQPTGNVDIDNWLNENVAYWVYVFIDPTANYTVLQIENNSTGVDREIGGEYGRIKLPLGLNGATSVFCYPIYKTALKDSTNYNEATNVIKILPSNAAGEDVTGFIPSEWGRKWFEEKNKETSNTSFYYQIKLSIVPPFDSAEGMYIDGTNLMMRGTTRGTEEVVGTDGVCRLDNNENTIFLIQGLNNRRWGLFFGSVQTKKSIDTRSYIVPDWNTYKKQEVITPQSPNLAYNPKLNGQNFKELVITAANGDTFTYDIQKISRGMFNFLYSEPIQPEITRYYMRLKPTGLYLEGTEENYTGLVGSTDNGLAFTNDQYSAFIANNKNFFMQSNMKIVTGAVKSTAGVISQAASGNIAGAVGSGLSAGLDVAQAYIDRSMTVDNMKNAPDQLKNANGNVLFNMFSTDLGLYVERYSALDGDLKTANDFMNLYGFSFDSVANVKDYVHIRKYHNYVKAQLQGITGNISNTARDDLRQRFANGIRFWNQDNISYQYENYELWLED